MKTLLPVLKIKKGVVFKHAHMRQHITCIITVALETAPVMEDGAVWITEAYRKIRNTLDFHELCAALDFRCKTIVVREAMGADRRVLGERWAERMGKMLGPDYDCIAHGVGGNFHLHVEFDPR